MKKRKTPRKISTAEKRMMIFDLIKVFSYSRVAEMMGDGATKNSIAGFVFRDKHKTPPIEKPINHGKSRVRKVKTVIIPEPTNEGITIFELKNDSCRFMIGDHKYCGKKEYKLSNCEFHFKMCRQPNRKKA